MSNSVKNLDSNSDTPIRATFPRVLIATDSVEKIKDLAAQLRQLRYDVQISFYDGKTLSATPRRAPVALICHFTKFMDRSAGIIRILKSHYAPHDIPVIGVSPVPHIHTDTFFDTVLVEPVHASQIANRVNSLVRLGAMEREIKLRVRTLEKDFGQSVMIEDDGEHPPFKILFIGQASPGFMVIINALQSKNVETVAAFTSFSAFDYLHETKFDAVVMNALDHPEPALSISETMRRNARLFHVPTLFLVNSDTFEYSQKAHSYGARDIINVNSDVEEISGRILELANYHRLHDNLKEEFESLGGNSSICEKSGCFTNLFMERHAERVVRANHKIKEPVTLMAVKLHLCCAEEVSEEHAEKALLQFGHMLKNLVRMQDSVAAYEADRYLLMFPGSNEAEAKVVLERVKGLVACTAFEGGSQSSPLTLTIDYAIAEAMSHENSDFTIGRLMSDLKQEPTRNFLEASA
ncbi:hypothetical protein [Litorimonas haliclonae]|uniref:hypothetical protein n=1 Tax=Litorimonas haliclonae TaxID=2081977 RepID=UPI0039F07ABD